MQPTASPYMSRREAAQYLNVSEKWMTWQGRAAAIPFYKFGGKCQYLRSDLDHWARQQRVTR